MKGNSNAITIRSIRELFRLERFIEEILDFYNIPGDYFGNIMLAVTEAAELGLRDQQKVCVEMGKNPKGLSFKIIRQEAMTEELDELDKAIAIHAIARETFIIRSLADEAKLLENGKVIELKFHITGISLERSLLRSEKIKNFLSSKEKVIDKNE